MSTSDLGAVLRDSEVSRLRRLQLAVSLARAVARIHRQGGACGSLEAGAVRISGDGSLVVQARDGRRGGERVEAVERAHDMQSMARLLSDLVSGALPGADDLLRRCRDEGGHGVHDAGTVALLLEDSLAREVERRDRRRLGRRLAWPGLIGALVCAGTLAAAFLAGGGDGPRASGDAAVRVSLRLQDGSFPKGHPGPLPVLSRDGRLLAVLDGPPERKRPRVFELDTGRDRWLEDLPDDATPAAFSPRGDEALYFAWDRAEASMALWLRPLSGGEPRRLASTAEHRGASWGPDGQIVFNSRNQGGLSTVPAAGGPIRILTEPDRRIGETTHHWPSYLPDGRGVLFVAGRKGMGPDGAEICVVETATGRVTSLLKGGTQPSFLPPDTLLYAREGRLMSVSFDPERLEVTGTPRQAMGDLLMLPWIGYAGYAVAPGGTLAWVAGRDVIGRRDLIRITAAGRRETVAMPSSAYSYLDFAPDGRRFMATLGGDLWLFDADRLVQTRITLDGASHSRWTPDGRRVAYFHWEGDDAQIRIVPVDGSEPPSLLFDEPGGQVPMDFSPDGSHLLYATERPVDGMTLRVWELEDRRSWPLAKISGGDEGARFSPGGRWVACLAESGNELRLISFPDGDVSRTIARGTVRLPQWTAAGDLYFTLDGRMHVVERAESLAVAGEEMTVKPLPEALGLGPRTVVAPDGMSFLTVSESPPEPVSSILLALGWTPPS